MAYLLFKAFHLIGVVVWFSGLFYLGRLFVYYVEANTQPEPTQTIVKELYQIMEKRLYYLITTPGMVVAIVMAIALLITEPQVLKSNWLHFKLILVIMLINYHFLCGFIMQQLTTNEHIWNSQNLRYLNEFPTLLLVAIVLLAVFKENLPLHILIISMTALSLAIAITIPLYAKKRQQEKAKLSSVTNLIQEN